MRGLSVGTLLVVVLLAAGCGGGSGGGGGGSTGSSQSSGEAAKPAKTVVADAVKAAGAASSLHMSGQVVASGRPIGVDLSIVRGKGATGSFTLRGAKVDLVVIGKSAYIRAGSDFWKQYSQASGLVQLLAGKWLKFPANNSQLGPLLGPANEKALFNKLESHNDKLVNRGVTTYKGRSVVAIYGTKKHGTLYVAASGTPYPVGLVKAKGKSSGTLTFDRWNQSVTLTAPKGALDFSHLGSG
jgi:hypothetical protein